VSDNSDVRVGDADRALVNDAPLGHRPSGFDPSRGGVGGEIYCTLLQFPELFDRIAPHHAEVCARALQPFFSIPAGYALVPIKATEAMKRAAADDIVVGCCIMLPDHAEECWDLMVAASAIEAQRTEPFRLGAQHESAARASEDAQPVPPPPSNDKEG
jgi:hypothetical protein